MDRRMNKQVDRQTEERVNEKTDDRETGGQKDDRDRQVDRRVGGQRHRWTQRERRVERQKDG